jgi:hypothetical protein
MTETANIFQRVQASYDLERMRKSRIISVGCGGARSFLEDMARCGLGHFLLIDPDVVTAANIGTQQVYLEDIGKPKVKCIAQRIKAINPDAHVDAWQMPIEEVDDAMFAFATTFLHFCAPGGYYPDPEPFYTPLLGGFTDNFYAQARVNRLALQFGLPSLCVQLYEKGQAGEITFTYPGVTSACHRCILSPRYKAYLERGYVNTVTAEGAPIFATTRVNSLKGMIALALLHHGTSHPVWGDMLTRIGNRTLVQIRMHPDAPLQIFNKVFAGADSTRMFFDEAVWLPQEADQSCPDCGGTGNLLDARDRFADTRNMAGQAPKSAADDLPDSQF